MVEFERAKDGFEVKVKRRTLGYIYIVDRLGYLFVSPFAGTSMALSEKDLLEIVRKIREAKTAVSKKGIIQTACGVIVQKLSSFRIRRKTAR